MITQGDLEADHTATVDSREASEEANGSDLANDHAALADSLPVNSWLHLAEAARRLRWPMERLRSLARRGKVQTRRGNDGHLFVLITPDLVTKAQRLAKVEAEKAARLRKMVTRPTGDGLTADPSSDHMATENGREALATDLAAEVADLKAELVELQKEAVELRVALAKAEARAEKVEAVAQAKEAALRELVEELKAQLVEARKPWWHRWMGR